MGPVTILYCLQETYGWAHINQWQIRPKASIKPTSSNKTWCQRTRMGPVTLPHSAVKCNEWANIDGWYMRPEASANPTKRHTMATEALEWGQWHWHNILSKEMNGSNEIDGRFAWMHWLNLRPQKECGADGLKWGQWHYYTELRKSMDGPT